MEAREEGGKGSTQDPGWLNCRGSIRRVSLLVVELRLGCMRMDTAQVGTPTNLTASLKRMQKYRYLYWIEDAVIVAA